jgi:hypothetical protein
MRSVSRLLFLSLAFLIATGVHASAAAGARHSGAAAARASSSMHPYRVALEPRMYVEGINNQGWIVGHWTDTAGKTHWFLMNPFLPMFSDVANHGAAHVEGLTANESGGLAITTDVGG